MVDWFGGITAPNPPSGYRDRQQISDIINSGITGIDKRQAPQTGYTQLAPAAQIDQSQQGQFRDLQMGQANRLNAIAAGQQMGAGEMAVRRAAQDAYARQVGMANMQRGGNAPGAGIAAARNQVTIAGNAAGQAQTAAAQDQANANAQLTSALGSGRGADIGLATSQAGMQQQTNLTQGQMNQAANLANLDAQLRQTGMNDQARLAYLQQLTGMNRDELNGAMQAYAAQKQSTGAVGGILGAIAPIAGLVGLLGGGGGKDKQQGPSDDSGPVTQPDGGGSLGDQFPHGNPDAPTGGGGGDAPWTGQTSSGLTALPQQGTPPQQTAMAQRGYGLPQNYGYQAPNYGYAAPSYGYMAPQQQPMYVASDKDLKTGIADARSEVDELLDSLKPVAYEYKDEKHGKGRRAGILAQDMERSAAGKRIVEDTPEGKMLDVNKTLSALLAGVARINERTRKLEAGGAA